MFNGSPHTPERTPTQDQNRVLWARHLLSLPKMNRPRRLPVGAEIVPEGGVHFRVWAPRRRDVEVVLETASGGATDRQTHSLKLEPEEKGYFSGYLAEATAGMFYRYRLDGATDLFPDPASRFQPHGPHGPSQVIDASRFQWTDESWRGTPLPGQVIYEMHVGTFTRGGTFDAAIPQLARLRALGVTGEKLAQSMPEGPTMAEGGDPEIKGDSWVGVRVPTGTPKELVALLNREITKILALPDMKVEIDVVAAVSRRPQGST